MEVYDLIREMIAYEAGVPHRIQHFIKVYTFAKTIGESEHIPPEQQEILEIASIVHDIGIKPSLQKYGSSAGYYQEKEGPAPARALLEKLGMPETLIHRVCFLVGHHHTYNMIDGMDYQILIEADFLVNIFEEQWNGQKVDSIRKQCFRTKTGLNYLDTMFTVQSGKNE